MGLKFKTSFWFTDWYSHSRSLVECEIIRISLTAEIYFWKICCLYHISALKWFVLLFFNILSCGIHVYFYSIFSFCVQIHGVKIYTIWEGRFFFWHIVNLGVKITQGSDVGTYLCAARCQCNMAVSGWNLMRGFWASKLADTGLL